MQIVSNNYNSYVDIITCVLSILLFFLTTFSYNKKDYQLKLLNMANVSVFIAGFFSIIHNLTILNKYIDTNLEILIVYVSHHISNICQIFVWIIILLYLYTVVFYRKVDKTKKRTTLICGTLLLFYIILECLSPFTKFGFHVIDGICYEHFWFNPFVISYFFYAISYIICFIVYRKTFPSKTFFYICILTIYCFLIMFLGALLKTTTFNVFTFYLPILFIYIIFHGNKFNIESGSLGPESFYSFIDSLFKKKKNFVLISLYINDEGLEESEDLFFKSAIYCSNIFKQGTLFKKNKDILNIIIKDSYNVNIKNNIEKLNKIIFEMRGNIDVKIVLMEYFNHTNLNSTQQIIEFNKNLVNKAPLNKFYKQTQNDLDLFLKMEYINSQLIDIVKTKDLNDSRVLVYCQPILNQERKYKNAEMLMRLDLEETGMVFPNDFIPIAEKKNLIHFISLIMLNKTCNEIKKLLESGYEIDRFSINFSAAEFNIPSFYDEVIDIIEKSNVPYNKLAFEITETSFGVIPNLNKIMDKLIEKGIIFYLDDFGTGYSNIDRISDLPFSTIKFDRSLVISSLKKDNTKFIVKHLCDIFKNLNFEILFEGVETNKDEDFCESMGAKYFQGYKYSKPIPIDTIKDYLTKK